MTQAYKLPRSSENIKNCKPRRNTIEYTLPMKDKAAEAARRGADSAADSHEEEDSMAASIKNDFGTMNIADSVIAKIAGITATECMGVLGLASADAIADLLKRESIDRGVHVVSDGESLQIDLSIIVKYGVSIAAVAENVISTVKYTVENLTGFNVDTVDVIVRGIRV